MNKEQVQIDEFYKWLHDHAMTRDDLVRIAEEARAVHAGFKLTRYNQHMYMAKVIEPIWLEVAQRIVEHEVSPAEFVSVVWSMYRDVYVPMLKSVAVANHLLQARIERRSEEVV